MRYRVNHPIFGLPDGEPEIGKIIDLDEATAVQLVEVKALSVVPSDDLGGDPVSPSPEGKTGDDAVVEAEKPKRWRKPKS